MEVWQLVFAAPGSHGASPVTFDVDRATGPFNRAAVLPGESTDMQSFAGHVWVARETAGSCIGGVPQTLPGAGPMTYAEGYSGRTGQCRDRPSRPARIRSASAS